MEDLAVSNDNHLPILLAREMGEAIVVVKDSKSRFQFRNSCE
jgi:hypothetical protein